MDCKDCDCNIEIPLTENVRFMELEQEFALAVDELRESEEKYRSVVENIKQVVFQTDAAGLWNFLNVAWTEVTDFTIDESIGTNFLEYVYPEDRERSTALFRLLINREKDSCRHEVRYLTKSGSPCWVEVFARVTLDSHGNVVGTSGVLTDINQRKEIEAELQRYQEHLEELVKMRTEALECINKQLRKYKLLAKHAKDIMLFVNMDGCIIKANEAAIRAYGYTREELLSMTIHDLRESSTSRQIKAQMAVGDKDGIFFETVHKCKDGSLLPVEVSSQGTDMDDEHLMLSVIRDISERKQAEEQLKYMETHDFLTGIPNRYYLEEHLKEVVLHSNEERKGVLLFIDIDNFKVINDSFGHVAGDQLLVDLGNKLKNTIRQDDFIARLGGDEFAIVLRDMTIDGARKVANRIIEELSQETFNADMHGNYCNINVSIGIAQIDGFVDTQKIFAYADVALYSAKEDGKRRAVAIENGSEKDRLSETNATVKLISDCLNDDRLVLYYQPIMSGQEIIHYEALLRILDNEGEIIYPNAFIPTAERFGLMSQIDRWVIRRAIQTLSENDDIVIFVNVSPLSVGDDELLTFIEVSLLEKGVKPAKIGFEITETAAVKDLEKAAKWISRLKQMGCKFALDDFGVGFTSFTHLQMLPIDYIKIDGVFIKNLDTDPTQKALVQAMNAVAHALGKKTIGEFVENETIWSIVQELGIDLGQGYYLGKPSPLEKIRCQNL